MKANFGLLAAMGSLLFAVGCSSSDDVTSYDDGVAGEGGSHSTGGSATHSGCGQHDFWHRY